MVNDNKKEATRMKKLTMVIAHNSCRRARAVVAFLFPVLLLTSCLADTDRVAVYPDGVLTRPEIEAIAGYYRLIELDGGFTSLSLVSRTEPWPYEQAPGAPASASNPGPVIQALAAADVSLKSVGRFEGGDAFVLRLDGVAVLSRIPGTDLILASVPGETFSIRDEQGKMTPPSEQNKTKNMFFVFQPAGKILTLKLYRENDEDLQRVFGYKATLFGSSNPLPTASLLNYLKSRAARDFAEDDLPILIRSTRKQREATEKEFNAISLREAARKSEQRKPDGG